MPYFGARVDLEKFFITVRIHGPLDVIPQEVFSEIKTYISGQVGGYKTDNLPLICEMLAEDIENRYLDGRSLLWVQVEIITKQNLIFGASAEKIPEECLQ
jgi:hypothetical protein